MTPEQEALKFKKDMRKKKEKAKKLYFKGHGAVTIAEQVDANLATVKSWIYGGNNKKNGWKSERDMSQNQLLKDLTENKRQMVHSMVDGCMFLIYDFVQKAKKDAIVENKPVDIKTAEKLTAILGNLHKIVESEEDKSTDDGNFVTPTSPKELQERIIKADPFAKKDVVVEAKEVKNETNNKKPDISVSNDDDEWFD